MRRNWSVLACACAVLALPTLAPAEPPGVEVEPSAAPLPAEMAVDPLLTDAEAEVALPVDVEVSVLSEDAGGAESTLFVVARPGRRGPAMDGRRGDGPPRRDGPPPWAHRGPRGDGPPPWMKRGPGGHGPGRSADAGPGKGMMQSQVVFALMDIDGNGSLSPREFAHGMRKIEKHLDGLREHGRRWHAKRTDGKPWQGPRMSGRPGSRGPMAGKPSPKAGKPCPVAKAGKPSRKPGPRGPEARKAQMKRMMIAKLAEQARYSFKKTDANNDGKLTANEVPESRREGFKKLLERADKNDNDALDGEEARAAFGHMMRRVGQSDHPGVATARVMFMFADVNADGKVSADEVPEDRRARFTRMISYADKDGDKALSREEAKAMVEKMRERAKAWRERMAKKRKEAGKSGSPCATCPKRGDCPKAKACPRTPGDKKADAKKADAKKADAKKAKLKKEAAEKRAKAAKKAQAVKKADAKKADSKKADAKKAKLKKEAAAEKAKAAKKAQAAKKADAKKAKPDKSEKKADAKKAKAKKDAK